MGKNNQISHEDRKNYEKENHVLDHWYGGPTTTPKLSSTIILVLAMIGSMFFIAEIFKHFN